MPTEIPNMGIYGTVNGDGLNSVRHTAVQRTRKKSLNEVLNDSLVSYCMGSLW